MDISPVGVENRGNKKRENLGTKLQKCQMLKQTNGRTTVMHITGVKETLSVQVGMN